MDFKTIMQEWRRLCDAFTEAAGDGDTDPCKLCPLAWSNCAAIWEMDSSTDWDKVCETIMKWAEEHPKPVYPTWFEYLKSAGVIEARDGYSRYDFCDIIVSQLENTPISTDIAQKLDVAAKAPAVYTRPLWRGKYK